MLWVMQLHRKQHYIHIWNQIAVDQGKQYYSIYYPDSLTSNSVCGFGFCCLLSWCRCWNVTQAMNVMRNVTSEDTIVVITKVTAMGAAPIPEHQCMKVFLEKLNH